jgi:starch synthase
MGTRSVFTIHNIEYQGRYSKHLMEDVFGLSWDYFNERMLEYHDDVNLMKGAIYASDFITTVSPTYAEQLRYSFFAHGLEGVITDCNYKICGILNGLDVALYDPSSDSSLAKTFTPTDLSGKAECKAALQRMVGLDERPNVPVIACVSRLVSHKGFDLVAAVIDDIMAMDVQMVVLGTGDWKFEELFRQAADRYPGRFSAQLMYSAVLSTTIYGGADLFLMPSISEPCGLSQIIAMRYGTLPIVRETGGLKDTVLPHLHEAGRGFTFADINAHDMAHVIYEAVKLYNENQNEWKRLQWNAMTTDFSWNGPAGQYLDIYQHILGQ